MTLEEMCNQLGISYRTIYSNHNQQHIKEIYRVLASKIVRVDKKRFLYDNFPTIHINTKNSIWEAYNDNGIINTQGRMQELINITQKEHYEFLKYYNSRKVTREQLARAIGIKASALEYLRKSGKIAYKDYELVKSAMNNKTQPKPKRKKVNKFYWIVDHFINKRFDVVACRSYATHKDIIHELLQKENIRYIPVKVGDTYRLERI